MKKTNVLRLLAFTAVCTLMVGCTAPAGGGATTTQDLEVTTTTTQTETTVPSGDGTTTIPTNTNGTVKPTATLPKTKTSVDLMKNIKAGKVTGKETDDVFAKASTQLALNLFKAAIAEDEDENVLVSPLSVQIALAMTANGADGKTLEEMETVLGGIKIADLNRYLYTYNKDLPTEETCSVKSVNGIWFRNGLNVKQPFLKANADYYGAAAYQSAFNAQTVKDINSWVSKQTDGMIDSLVDEIDKNDVMYLINTLLFEASWESKFLEEKTQLGTFVTEEGEERKVEMLYSPYETCGFDDGRGIGFIKKYEGGKYSFVAIIPDERCSVEEYVSGLTVDGVRTMLQTPHNDLLAVLFPKFDVEYEFETEDTLEALGMKSAFGGGANFSGIDDSGAYLSDVLHKTSISVSKEGTKAAAATKVVRYKGLPRYKMEFTRPFVYMIVDNEADMPLFIGTVKDLKGMSDSVAAQFEKEHPVVQNSIVDPKVVTYARSFGEGLFTINFPEEWKEKSGWSFGDLNKYCFSDDVKAGISLFADGLTYDGKEFPMLSLFAVKTEDAEKIWAKIKAIPDLKIYDESTPKMWGADGIWYCEEKEMNGYTIFSVSVGNLMSEKWAGMNDENEAWQKDILIEKDTVAKSVSAKTIK